MGVVHATVTWFEGWDLTGNFTTIDLVAASTAGRYYVDLSSGVTPKQFIRGEWFRPDRCAHGGRVELPSDRPRESRRRRRS